MPVYRLDHRLVFPLPTKASASGLLAVGGDLRPERLILAYENGIFPWYGEGDPILWHSPAERFIVTPGSFRVGRSVEKAIRRGRFRLRFDRDFRGVITGCRGAPRPGQEGTWITPEMLEAYCLLHRLGVAHSAEAYLDGELVGGLYGLTLGGMFFGESMFSRADDASKVVFAVLARWLFDHGYALIDSQVYTDHVARFGGVEVPREVYLIALESALEVVPRVAWPTADVPAAGEPE